MEEDFSIDITSDVFDTDFDEAGWEPEVIKGDEDEDAANEYGY